MANQHHEAVLETQRLLLRHFVVEDASAIEAVFCDPAVMRYSDGVESPEWVQEWLTNMIHKCYPKWGFGAWAIEEKSARDVIGYCGLSRFPSRCGPDEAELGFRLVRNHWGCGYATEAALPTCDLGLRVLGLSRIVAIIDPDNIASVHVAQKVGMRYRREIMFDGYTHPDHLYVIP